MKLILRNFRSFENIELVGEKIIVEGSNGQGKSNLLYAIEWLLFGTIQGRKQGIEPITFGKKDCMVSLDEFERHSGNSTAYIDPMYRPILFCNLLDQEYSYIKKILAEVVVSKEAKNLFGSYWKGTIDMTIKEIKKEFTVKNKVFLDAKNRVSFLQEQVERLAQYEPETLTILEDEYILLNEQYQSTLISGDPLQKILDQAKEIKSQIESKENIISQLRLNQTNSVKDAEHIAEKGKALAGGICPICKAPFKDDNVIEELRSEYKEKSESAIALTEEIEKISNEVVTLISQLKNLQTDYEKLKAESTLTSTTNQALKEKMINAQKLFYDYKSAVSQKINFEQELDATIKRLITYQEDPIFIMNEYIAPKGELNQLLAAAVNEIFPGIDINILAEDKFGDTVSTFSVKKDGVEYRDLSRSQKLALNISVSNNILKRINKYGNLPLCIDDSEMFSKEHFQQVAETLDCFIATKVTDNPLSFYQYENESNQRPTQVSTKKKTPTKTEKMAKKSTSKKTSKDVKNQRPSEINDVPF